MSEIVDAVETSPVQKDSGLAWRGLIQVFTKPTEFFDKLKNDPKVLVPFILLFALVALAAFLMSDVLGQMQYDEAMRASEDQGQPLPAFMDVEFFKWMSLIYAPIMLMAPLLYAAIAMFVGNFFMGGEAKYKSLLSVMIFAEILFTVGTLLHAPLIMAKGTIFVSYSLAAIVQDPVANKGLWAALSKVSVFHIWEIVVAGIGFAAVYGFKRNKGYVISVITIGTLALVAAVLALFQA